MIKRFMEKNSFHIRMTLLIIGLAILIVAMHWAEMQFGVIR